MLSDDLRRTGTASRPRVVGILAGVVLLGLGTVACGDEADDPGPGAEEAATATADGGGAAEGDGCALVSTDEVAEATGDAVDGAADLPSGCQWTLADGSGRTHEWQSLPRATYDENLDLADDAGFRVETVDGLGDDAFRRNQESAAGDLLQTELWVAVGDEALFVRSVGIAPSDDLLADHEALATLLVDRLG